jgi:hypothetical protein
MVGSAFAIDDTQVDPQPALCRSYSGTLANYGQSVQDAIKAVAARGVKVVGEAFATFPPPPIDESKLMTAVTSWKVCVVLDGQPPSTTPDDGFAVETIPAHRVVSTSCTGLPDAKTCHGQIAAYLTDKKLGILGGYINTKDATNTITMMSVPVGPLPQP